MEVQKGLWNKIKEYLFITLAVELVVIGVYFFKFPNNYSTGGVTGIAIILSKLFGDAISSGTVVLVLNILLLIIGYIFVGKSFGSKTVYGSILMSISIRALELIVPMNTPLTSEPLLELLFAVGIPAVGAAMLFNVGGSTGGTDIIAMILKKYSSIDIGRALFYTDLSLTLTAFLVFDIQTGLLSLLGLLIKSLAIDSMIESMNLHKYFTIVSENPQPISDYILGTLKSSATLCNAEGAFSHKQKTMILTIMNRSQAVQLRRFIKQTEPTAFIFITNTSEIIGRGFRA